MPDSVRRAASIALLLAVLAVLSTAPLPEPTHAATASELQSQIDAHNSQITALQNEIAQYQKQLDALGSKRSTLESTIQTLTISRKKLNADLAVTQNRIDAANLHLKQLGSDISVTQSNITSNNAAIAQALRTINENDATAGSPLALVLGADGLSEAWRVTDQLSQFNHALGNDVNALTQAKTELTTTQTQVSATKSQLVSLKNDQISQRKSIDANTAAQQTLLNQTKNKESSYQKLIAQKKAAEKEFAQELEDLQSQLNLIVNPGSLPKPGSGVLAWPFSDSFMQSCSTRKSVFGNLFCISQYFGNTPFSTANPQVYNGHGHNAIDIAAPVGTPLHAALGGVVLGTGNTDLAHDSKGNQCWSFGKWVMIAHPNGINTLYSHLSEIDVSKGQSVATGQVIGYSGMTGYATGPHLHFGVYAADGTKIMTLGSFKGTSGTPCAGATMPVATLDAYLNPLSYLPR